MAIKRRKDLIVEVMLCADKGIFDDDGVVSVGVDAKRRNKP